MAINIFSGGAAKSTKAPRVSSAAQRAEATTSAIQGPAEASNSGATAVKSGGILGKILPMVSNVANTIGEFAPGPFGAIAKVVGKLTSSNDPEWWQTVKGDGLTTNTPLRESEMGKSGTAPYLNVRPAILEFEALPSDRDGDVINVTERMITQYLMPAVRKVSNAITLQAASSYKIVIQHQATMYALWRCLKKYDFFLKHGQTFLPNINDVAFPVFQVANAAWLQSTITRLEEYLHANVRLPHTLCEYLTWRFGKVFRMNNSAKAGFVFYDILPMTAATTEYDSFIANIMNELSSTEGYQKAVSDLYNAYLDHDQEVYVSDDTMLSYDSKEFVLRTNLDLLAALDSGSTPWTDITENCIIMDSNLDNPTVFMASTVSCKVASNDPLFPVYRCYCYINPSIAASYTTKLEICVTAGASSQTNATAATGYARPNSSTLWNYMEIEPIIVKPAGSGGTGGTVVGMALQAIQTSILAKAADFYNVGIFLPVVRTGSVTLAYFDLTSISIDAGNVPDLIIDNEQVIAFANLVTEEHKNATTYRQAERRVAKDVANFIENNEVAALTK